MINQKKEKYPYTCERCGKKVKALYYNIYKKPLRGLCWDCNNSTGVERTTDKNVNLPF